MNFFKFILYMTGQLCVIIICLLFKYLNINLSCLINSDRHDFSFFSKSHPFHFVQLFITEV